MNDQQQRIADVIKPHLMKMSPPDARREAMRLLQRFEASAWYPPIFDAALAANPALSIGERVQYSGSLDCMYSALVALLTRYLDTLRASLPEAAPGRPLDSTIYTTAEAMAYVEQQTTAQGKPLGARQVRRYIMGEMEDYLLAGTMKGKTLLFTQDELDQFVRWYIQAEIRPGVKVGGPNRWTKKA